MSAAFAFAQTISDDAAARYAAAGQQALAAGRYAEAQTDYEKLAKLEPGIAEIHATLAVIDFKLRDYELAVGEVQTAQRLKPSLPRLDSLLGMALAELGRFADALPGLEKGFKQSADAEIRRMCGLQLERAYTGLKRDSKAVEVAMELNRLYPDDPEILYQTGKIYGNFAFLTMQKLAEVAPSSVWRHQAAAEADESQGSYSLAVTEYRQVLALEPDRPGVHYRLGRTLLARSYQVASAQDTAEAAKEFEQELQRDPTNANAAYELGEIRRKSGQFDEAQKLFKAALKDYPNFEEAHLGLASVLLSWQKLKLALPHLHKAIELNAQNEVAWYRLGQALKALGNTAEQQKALAEYRRLHDEANQQRGIEPVFSPREVTKQAVDPNAQ
ncbi:MAG TPA: tetratricopeptide repeat protein [Candidatus Elarobacter sp.]|nr:tetratricopeptide repeat protein [Candidatus Elarobacter sp.]